MKYIMLVLLLAGCTQNPEVKFTDGRILKDKNGCAFLVNASRDNSTYNVVLKFNKDESLATCDFYEVVK